VVAWVCQLHAGPAALILVLHPVPPALFARVHGRLIVTHRRGYNDCSMNTAERAAVIDRFIPRPPADVAPLRNAFSGMVARQWEMYLLSATAGAPLGATHAQSVKARFIAQMYARACYSMLLLSACGPALLRVPVRATSMLPISRGMAIALGSALLSGLNRMVPRAMHRQLLLTSALMGALDVVLDEAASSGEEAVLRIASLITPHAPRTLIPAEQPIATLTRMIRQGETGWQSGYWENILVPAVRAYCMAEALAVAHAPDPKGMGHRWDGIDSAIKGMWYVVGPCMGLGGSLARFEKAEWNREQHWMADTSLLVQMIDDWVDHDEDSGARLTPVVAGHWSTTSVDQLYRKTARDLATMLTENRIRNRVLQGLFLDLYNDYLHVAIEAMRSGVAA
jgi:hypothetical protein